MSKEKPDIMVVAAHCDDEILGCGGTIMKLAKLGHRVHIRIMSEGATSRYPGAEMSAESIEAQKCLREAALKASTAMGAASIEISNLPDNRFDTLALLDLAWLVEDWLDSNRDTHTILTHFPWDLNVDHRVTAQAVLTAARPLPGSPVQQILAFEIPSSTEWGLRPFEPDTYVELGTLLAHKKIELMATHYDSELRDYPHARSVLGIASLMELRGAQSGLEQAEAFMTLRRREIL